MMLGRQIRLMMTTCHFNMNTLLPKICGFNRASEIGVDTFSPSIFLSGCNFHCPYCMNSRLVNGKINIHVGIEEVKKFVQEEGSEWLMISGGEPTCTPIEHLINLFKEIESWGCKIGMSTNGSNFNELRRIIKYLNYVALDIKASNISDYQKLSDKNVYKNLLMSLYLLRIIKKSRNDFSYELRTTLFPPFINNYTLDEIGSRMIHKEDKWVLQQFRHAQNILDPSCKNIEPYSDEDVKVLINIAKNYCNNVSLRFV